MRDFDILIVFPLPVLNPDLTLPSGTGVVVAALPIPLLLLLLLLLLLFDVPTAPVAAASAAAVNASITSFAVASAVRVGPRGGLAVDEKSGEATGKTAGVGSDPCESFLRMGDTGGEAGRTTVWSASSSSPSPSASPALPSSSSSPPP
jgi:hypothetical protein